MTIAVFVYGTLKRGQPNHDRFCAHAIDIQPATVVGRLYHLRAGFPALEIPEEAILAVGTPDPLADARTQAHWQARLRDGIPPPPTTADVSWPDHLVPPDDTWQRVHGELITFPDATRDLPPLDRLEGLTFASVTAARTSSRSRCARLWPTRLPTLWPHGGYCTVVGAAGICWTSTADSSDQQRATRQSGRAGR